MPHRWTPATAKAAGRLGGLTTRSRHDPNVLLAPARAARTAQIDAMLELPDGLDQAEREARLKAHRSAYFGRMSLAGVKAKRLRRLQRLQASRQIEGATQ